jgi:MoxR-like ATPase
VAELNDEKKTLESADDIALVDRMRRGREEILTELRKVIVGQDDVVELVLTTLFVGGNSLLVGVPGLAKTLLIHTTARVMDLNFARIQFTPDLMPSDITGTDIISEDPETGRRSLVFSPGPIFSHIILADEVNRTPPKTQSALLEAMQEHRVTVQGRTYTLEEPFYVFATQNPIELEGTYPLPEAQLDRFMFEIQLNHLPEEEEVSVVRRTTQINRPTLSRAVTREELIAFQELVRKVPVSDAVLRYAVAIARATRPEGENAADFVKEFVSYGSSVRGIQNLILAAKARALTQGRLHVTFEDIQSLCPPIFRHRILTNFHADSEGVTSESLLRRIVESVPVPKSGL